MPKTERPRSTFQPGRTTNRVLAIYRFSSNGPSPRVLSILLFGKRDSNAQSAFWPILRDNSSAMLVNNRLSDT